MATPPTPGPTPKGDPRSWHALTPPLAQWILDFVSSSGFSKMTPVQAATLANFLGKSSKDVVVEAVTGSGKTLAYLIPVVQRLLDTHEHRPRHHIGAIVVVPTRELAVQIHSVLLSLLAFHEPSATILPYLNGDGDDGEESRPAGGSGAVVVPQLLVGGAAATPAQDLGFALRHDPNLLVATPGRLVELLSSPRIRCTQSSFEVLVLDEADRLLDLGFKPDLQSILARLPKQRRTGLFSASVGEAVGELIRVGLRNPVRITVRVRNLRDGRVVEDRRTPASLQMSYVITPSDQKLSTLAQVLATRPRPPHRTIVFLSTCAAVDYFQHVLPAILPVGFSLIPLHGKHQPSVRDRNFGRFACATSPAILLTTDLASRGLDIPQVDLVVQIDPPSDPKVFIHRCGRAGRAGRRGLAVVMLHPGLEEDYVQFMAVRQTPVSPLEPALDDVGADHIKKVTATIRALVQSDRALHDKAQRAFVSWLRSYAAHQATSIFRVRDLDWAALAAGWGLLRLPRMPEARYWEGNRSLGLVVDWDAYAYKDKKREKARKEELEMARQTGGKGTGGTSTRTGKRKQNEAWNGKIEKEEFRTERREKRQRRRDAERRAGMTDEERTREAELEGLLAAIRQQNKTTQVGGGKVGEPNGTGTGTGGGAKGGGGKVDMLTGKIRVTEGTTRGTGSESDGDGEFEGFDD